MKEKSALLRFVDMGGAQSRKYLRFLKFQKKLLCETGDSQKSGCCENSDRRRPVKAERWPEVERLYHAALERKPEERSAFLHEKCGDDEALRREVESLLAYQQESEDFIESPALDVAAKIMAKNQSASVANGQMIRHYRIASRIG